MTTVIPSHLPSRLSICFYGWNWLIACHPDEAWYDLEEAVRETKEWGFNCIRADTGALLTHDASGRPRGPIHFRPWIEDGLNWNLHLVNARGHIDVDVLARVVELFRLADKYDLTVILTSWLYQDVFTQLEDPALLAEIVAIPYAERPMIFARQHDLLLEILKREGLTHRVAFVELLNEIEYTPAFVPKAVPPPEPKFEHWSQWTWAGMVDPAATVKACDEALCYLRDKYPGLLITLDHATPRRINGLYAPSSQLVDFHCYHGLMGELFDEVLLPWSIEEGPDLNQHPKLKSFLKPNPCAWKPFREKLMHLRSIGPFWHRSSWFYHNMDLDVFDAWYAKEAAARHESFVERAEDKMGIALELARARDVPLVIDEGYSFYPPFYSRIYHNPICQRHEEIQVEIALRDNYWGITPTSYVRPDSADWHEPVVKTWLQQLNRRILG